MAYSVLISEAEEDVSERSNCIVGISNTNVPHFGNQAKEKSLIRITCSALSARHFRAKCLF